MQWNGKKVVSRAVLDSNGFFKGFVHVDLENRDESIKKCKKKAKKFGKPYGNVLIGFLDVSQNIYKR